MHSFISRQVRVKKLNICDSQNSGDAKTELLVTHLQKYNLSYEIPRAIINNVCFYENFNLAKTFY